MPLLAFVVFILWIIPETKMILQQFSAVPSSVTVRQPRNTSWWASRGRKGKRKTWWVTSAFTWYPRGEWSPLVTWLVPRCHPQGAALPGHGAGSWVSPGKVLCVPFTHQKGQFSLPGLANPSFAGNSKAKLISVPAPVVLWAVWIIYSSSGDRSSWNFIAWIL